MRENIGVFDAKEITKGDGLGWMKKHGNVEKQNLHMQFPIIARLDGLQALLVKSGHHSFHQAVEADQSLQLARGRDDGQLVDAAGAHHLDGLVDGAINCGGDGMGELQFGYLSLVHRNLVRNAGLLFLLAALARRRWGGSGVGCSGVDGVEVAALRHPLIHQVLRHVIANGVG